MTATNRNFLGDAPYAHVHSGEKLTIDSGGTLELASGATFTLGDPDFTGDLTVSGALLNRRKITSLTTASPDALTAADSGTRYHFNRAAGVAVVLPAITAAEVGVFYDFFFETTATGDHTITAQAADLLKGGALMFDFDAAYDSATRDGRWFAADGTDDLIITMNGTTKGGKVGSWLRLTAASATSWAVEGVLTADGVIVTPFS